MRIKFIINKNNFSRMVDFNKEYLELHIIDDKAILCCETGQIYAQLFLEVLELQTEENVNLRLPSFLFSKFKAEEVMEIILGDKRTYVNYYNKNLEFMSKISVSSQVGVIDASDKLELYINREKYEKYDFQGLGPIVTALAGLGQNVSVVDGILFAEYNRSYIFHKTQLPNFSCDAKLLKIIMTNSFSIQFLGKYIYSNFDNSNIDVFVTKSRVTTTCDMNYILKTKYTRIIDIDPSNISLCVGRAKANSSSDIIFDFKHNYVIVDDEFMSMTIKFRKLAEKVAKKEESNKDSTEELLNAFTNNQKVVAELDNEVSDEPVIEVPYWVLNRFIKGDKVRFYFSNSFIVVRNKGNSILISRSDINE